MMVEAKRTKKPSRPLVMMVLVAMMMFLMMVDVCMAALHLNGTLFLPHSSDNDQILSGAIDSLENKGYVTVFSPTVSGGDSSATTKLFRFTLSPLGFTDSSDFQFAVPKVLISKGISIDQGRSRLYVYGSTPLSSLNVAAIQSFNITKGSNFVPLGTFYTVASDEGFTNAMVMEENGHLFATVSELSNTKMFELNMTTTKAQVYNEGLLDPTSSSEAYKIGIISRFSNPSPNTKLSGANVTKPELVFGSVGTKDLQAVSPPHSTSQRSLPSSSTPSPPSLAVDTLFSHDGLRSVQKKAFEACTQSLVRKTSDLKWLNRSDVSGPVADAVLPPIGRFQSATDARDSFHCDVASSDLKQILWGRKGGRNEKHSNKKRDNEKANPHPETLAPPVLSSFNSVYPWPDLHSDTFPVNASLRAMQYCPYLTGEAVVSLSLFCANGQSCNQFSVVAFDKDLIASNQMFISSGSFNNTSSVSCIPQLNPNNHRFALVTVGNQIYQLDLDLKQTVSSTYLDGFQTIVWSAVSQDGTVAYVGAIGDEEGPSSNAVVQILLS